MIWLQDQLLKAKKYIEESSLKENNIYYISLNNYNKEIVSEILCLLLDCNKEILIYRNGIMGVPITFFDKFNSSQFKIIGIANSARYIGDFPCLTLINKRKIYNRFLIRRNYED